MIAKRTFDLLLALIAMIILTPFFFLVAIVIILDSKGNIFYKQTRVGMNMVDFKLIKFRTMIEHAHTFGELTVGSRDARITRVGYWLRKYKIDELPQLLNIIKGEMSFVGPRPEVRKYVDLYDLEQQRVFAVKPGLTDWASIQFINENELLAQSNDPELFYINEIIPVKLNQNLYYVEKHDLTVDLTIIFLTLKRIVFNR